MQTIYEALLRVEKLFNCKSFTDTSELLGMPKNTFYDNYKKAKADYEKFVTLQTETNPIKRDLLQKSLDSVKQKHYTNALYHQFVELAAKHNLNLNWIFYNEQPVYRSSEKIAKIIKSHYIKESVSEDTTFITYFEDIKNIANSEHHNTKEDKHNVVVLPKSILKGKNIVAVKILDNSMSPNLKENSLALIDLSKKNVKNASVYIVKYKNNFLIRRLELQGEYTLLRSDNISYNTINAKSNEVEILAQVVSSIQVENFE